MHWFLSPYHTDAKQDTSTWWTGDVIMLSQCITHYWYSKLILWDVFVKVSLHYAALQTSHSLSYMNTTAFWSKADRLRMRAFSYTCSLPVTWQRWWLHHSICPTREHHAAHKLHRSMFDPTELLPTEGLHCGMRNFRPFWLLWPEPDDLHIRTRPADRGGTSHVQIWTSYIKAFESYRMTDIHTDRHD